MRSPRIRISRISVKSSGFRHGLFDDLSLYSRLTGYIFGNATIHLALQVVGGGSHTHRRGILGCDPMMPDIVELHQRPYE